MLPIRSSLASIASFSCTLHVSEKLTQAVNTAVRLIFHNDFSGYARLIGTAGALVMSFKCTKWIFEQFKIAESIRQEAIDMPVLEDLIEHKFEKHIDDASKFVRLANAAINRFAEKKGENHYPVPAYRKDLREFKQFLAERNK